MRGSRICQVHTVSGQCLNPGEMFLHKASSASALSTGPLIANPVGRRTVVPTADIMRIYPPCLVGRQPGSLWLTVLSLSLDKGSIG